MERYKTNFFMKKFKNILKLFALGSVFVLGSCEKDLYEDQIYKSNTTLKIVSLKNDSIKKNFQLMKAVNEAKLKAPNANSRMVYDSINNFRFDDEKGFLIEDNGKESYTFRVYRGETTDNEKLENIVFEEKEAGIFDTYLVKYAISKNQLENIYQLGEAQQEYPIEDVKDITANKVTAPKCRTVRVSLCSGDPWDCGGNICGWDYVIECDEGSGGGSNSNDALSGPKDLVTSPNGGGAAAANPCKKFKKQKDELPALNQALINLEATKTQNHENGIFIDSSSPNVQNGIPSTTSSSTVNFPDIAPPNKYKVMAHTHDAQGPNGTGTFSIFSWGDLLEAVAIIRDNEADDDFFTMYLATADNTRYALTIDSTYGFVNFFNVVDPNNPTITDQLKAKKLIDMEAEYYADNATVGSGKIGSATNPADDLKIFLKMLKEMGSSVSLFEVDPTYTIFTKLTLSSNGTTVVPKAPCN
jgi:hypothetical protein